jgi:hypothetical protein
MATSQIKCCTLGIDGKKRAVIPSVAFAKKKHGMRRLDACPDAGVALL